MNLSTLLAGLCAAALLIASPALARDRHVRAEFQRYHPCPSTGLTHGRCPGYVADHRIALCLGGPDTVTNLQWQEYRASLVKDREERRQCAAMRRAR